MGLQLLEREKRVLHDVENPEPQFAGHEYLLEKYLKPRARRDVIAALAEEKLRPTAMIDLSDGLASDLMQLCKASDCGARIDPERIPLPGTTASVGQGDEHHPVVAALNGGQDHELLFTVPLSMQEQVMRLGLVDVIGHITPAGHGVLSGNARRQRHPPQSPGIQRGNLTAGPCAPFSRMIKSEFSPRVKRPSSSCEAGRHEVYPEGSGDHSSKPRRSLEQTASSTPPRRSCRSKIPHNPPEGAAAGKKR